MAGQETRVACRAEWWCLSPRLAVLIARACPHLALPTMRSVLYRAGGWEERGRHPALSVKALSVLLDLWAKARETA
ncbi:hypothetical protein E2C01_091919 [Portunus trituberculatus]|uniref:Uncharacterized protein n=1 Tax=Portunus trituberculatus TaxID=210409 RepID=A0A5B7JP97_PORTR|nr:hypothetical protein [Portunus trituberculatus]